MGISIIEAKQVYEALWRRATDAGARVYYNGLPLSPVPGVEVNGWFTPPGTRRPKPEIMIMRPNYVERYLPHFERNNGEPVDVERELITLAHEFGHFLSWKGESDPDEWRSYFEAANRRDTLAKSTDGDGQAAVAAGLTDEEKNLIIAEEERAWRIGRRVLSELGLSSAIEMDQHESESMKAHREVLGLRAPP